METIKRSWGLFAILAIVFLMPIHVNAESASLPDAVNNVITLEDDVTLSSSITVAEGETLTIDLNGYTLTTSATITVNGNLTIKDSESGDGVLSSSTYAISVSGSSAVLTIESGNITNTKYYGIGVYSGGSVIVNGGSITSRYATMSSNNTKGEGNFEINGGTLTTSEGPAIYMPSQGTLTVTDGTINGGISARMGTITISGGTFNAITTGIDYLTDYFQDKSCYGFAYTGNIWLDSALYVIGGTYTSDSGNDLVLTITGGTFNTTNSTGSAVTIYDLGKVEQSMTVNISGGTFNTSSADEAFSIVKYSDLELTDEMKNSAYGVYEGNVSTTITGGTFSTDVTTDYVPSTYVVNNYTTYYKVEAQAIEATVEELDTTETVTEITVGVTNAEDLNDILSASLATSDIETDNINVSVSIDMETVDETSVEEAVVTSIESVVASISSDAVIAGYFDITITAYDADTNDKLGTLANLSSAVTFTVMLPEDLQEVADGYTRTYYVIRYHDGTAEKIEATLGDDETYITFESDKFSTYALTYVDTETTSQTTTTPTTTTDNPQTGDNWVVYIILGVVAAGGIIYLTTMDSKKKKTK